MKIAHLISEYLPSIGGAQICIHNVALEFGKRDSHVVVVTTTQDKTSTNYGYPIIRISYWYLRLLRFPLIGKCLLWYKLGRLQKKYRFDVWQVTVGYPLGAYAVDFFKNNRIPCILRCCGEDIQINNVVPYGYRRSPSVDIVVRKSYPKYDAVVALTESVREEYRNLGISDKKIYVIPNGVNLQRFTRKESKNEIKKRLGFENKTVLLTVGRSHPKKGYDLIPDILRKVYKNQKDIVWILIGKGCDEILFQGLSDELRNRLILLDEFKSKQGHALAEFPPSELINYYHGADLFVFPSYIESFGMVLIEANAAGLVSVAADVPGSRDVIKDGYNGCLVEPGNCEMFADKILTILKDKYLYEQICLNNSNDIKRYEWHVVAESYRELYNKVLLKNG